MRERFEAGKALAKRLAGAYCRRRGLVGLDAEEAHAQALEGLWEAARRFDASRGVPFAPYAQLRIRGRIVDSLRERERGLDRRLDRRQREVRFVRLDEEAPSGEGGIDLPARERGPDELAEAREDGAAWAAVPAGSRWLLRLVVVEGWTLREAAALHGLSESRACQIKLAALGAARRALGA